MLRRYVDEHRQEIVTVLGNLWDKYAVSFASIEDVRDKALKQSNRHLKELGYA